MSYICTPLSSLYKFQYNTSWANDRSVTICHHDANLFSLFSVITNKSVTPEPFASCMMTHVKAFNEFVCMFGISEIDFFYWFLAFTQLFKYYSSFAYHFPFRFFCYINPPVSGIVFKIESVQGGLFWCVRCLGFTLLRTLAVYDIAEKKPK